MIQKRRIAMSIVLSVITFGIYGIYWFVKLTDEVNAVHGGKGTSGGVAFLLTLVTGGIYGLYWAYKMGEKLDAIHTEKGALPQNRGVIYLLLMVLGISIVAYALMQDSLNKAL